MIRVLLVEDQTMMRDALGALLGLEPDIEVVGAVGNGDEGLHTAERREWPQAPPPRRVRHRRSDCRPGDRGQVDGESPAAARPPDAGSQGVRRW